ncbi:MAG: glutamate--tRNA ligase [Pseudomonadota bacterium]|nr:glutamate--tRNA ligase [Pseudomonadota bacterium]
MTEQPVRVRFAPSPTGSMHVGGIRTALYNYLFAKHHGGTMVLRIEDTDLERSDHTLAEEQLNDLRWLGIEWDEGPDHPGEFGPYYQSERLSFYQQYVDQLLKEGYAYYCFLTDDEIEAQKAKAEANGDPYQVISPYRDLAYNDAEVAKRLKNNEKATVRFKVKDPNRIYTFDDLVRGEINLPAHMVGDFVLLRSDGMPVYNFCCVIDDHSMKISHVFRGEEHLSNTLRQLMLYESLGFEIPKFGHLSIILDEDRKKLSKRHKAASCNDLKRLGYVPEGIINYLALLGWSHPRGDEILSKTDLVEAFTVDRVNASPAVFDIQKMHWLNGQHIRKMTPQHLWALLALQPGFGSLALPTSNGWHEKALAVIWSECDTLSHGVALLKNWFDQSHFAVDDEAKEILSWPRSKEVIQAWHDSIQEVAFLSAIDYENIVNDIKKKYDVKGKFLFMPLRVAMIGSPHGPDLNTLAEALPTKLLKERAQIALKLCN